MAAFFGRDRDRWKSFPSSSRSGSIWNPRRWKKTLDQAVLRAVIPEDAMDEDIVGTFFYEEDNGELHQSELFWCRRGQPSLRSGRSHYFNLVNDDLKSRGVLFSIHDEGVPVFHLLLRMRARRAGLIEDAKEVLLSCLTQMPVLCRYAGRHLSTSNRRSVRRCCRVT
jgi:hypothetical protein